VSPTGALGSTGASPTGMLGYFGVSPAGTSGSSGALSQTMLGLYYWGNKFYFVVGSENSG
jgi:hypothetical protein